MPFVQAVRRALLYARKVVRAVSGKGKWDFSAAENSHHVLTAGF